MPDSCAAGLIGWVLIDIAMAHKQYTQLGYVTPALLLVSAFPVGGWVGGLLAVCEVRKGARGAYGMMMALHVHAHVAHDCWQAHCSPRAIFSAAIPALENVLPRLASRPNPKGN